MRKALVAAGTLLALLWAAGSVPTFSHVPHDHDGEGPHDHCSGCVVAGSPALAPGGSEGLPVLSAQTRGIGPQRTVLCARIEELTPPGRAPPSSS